MIVDSFCFAQSQPSEQGLLNDIPLSIETMPATKASERHVCLFNTHVQLLERWLSEAACSATIGINALIPTEERQLQEWLTYESAFTAFVLHPYLQDIDKNCLLAIKRFLQSGALKGRPIFVCTAIGSQKIYDIEPLKVAKQVASWVSSPVILAHCGGAKIIDALLIADAYSHVCLETSFSLAYWQGSSVEQDIAFAMKKLGANRWLYGSDAPYCKEDTALQAHQQFFERFGFDDQCREWVMGRSAKQILSTVR